MTVEPHENDQDGPEKNGETSVKSLTSIITSQLHKPTDSTNNTTVRESCPAWKGLQYDKQKELMSSSICVKHKKIIAFTKGANNFRFSTLEQHCEKHEVKYTLVMVWMMSVCQSFNVTVLLR